MKLKPLKMKTLQRPSVKKSVAKEISNLKKMDRKSIEKIKLGLKYDAIVFGCPTFVCAGHSGSAHGPR
jgi:hypothetical protein